MVRIDLDPHVTLAFALQDTQYAVLLGAGASISCGMPSAWDVEQSLIERIAAAEGAGEIGDPQDWYTRRFGQAPSYDTLLDSLTSSAFGRQALLKSFFEPDETDREEGRKQPTAAHRAVARLAAAGSVKIVLTTNFDRLAETALREAGIEPTIVSHPDDITGLAPLHSLDCLVVHLHGDYLNPTSMLNTPAELAAYPPQLDTLLDRIFDEYGLFIAGWSGTWDTALRNAISRCTTRRFPTFWADPRPLSEVAQELLNRRAGTYVASDADRFIGQTADAVSAMADIKRHRPQSTAIAVASAKRALEGGQQAISLHDTLRRELNHVAELPLRNGPFDSPDSDAEHERRLTVLEAETERLLALVATTAYWGNEETDPWWLGDIEALGAPVRSGGVTTLLNLVRAPATMVIYAAGIAATAKGRWPTLVRVLSQPRAEDQHKGGTVTAAALLSPGITTGNAERMQDQLRPVFTEHLALSTDAYIDAWERFEYLRLLAANRVGQRFSTPFIRRAPDAWSYRPAPADWLQHEIDRDGDQHPLLQNGFAAGTTVELLATKKKIDEIYSQLHIRRTWGQ